MTFGPHPTTWTFALDARSTHSSIIAADENSSPIFMTPDAVSAHAGTFARTTSTPTDVAALLQLSVALLETSVVHYEFAALALEKCLQAIEAALRHRFSAGKNTTFSELIRRFQRETHPEPEMVEMLTFARELRNMAAHPTTAPALPIVVTVSSIHRSHDLVAEIYPEPRDSPSTLVAK
ncbi:MULTISPECIES: hypothetical protein [unclassified Microbacterium]|jgi:hypothetical protein|uniref:hypothetical protein n=1 Tax=unclassified Microbacterium TaxID=2609290 RepID=UPI0021A6C9D2|nr:MULTISPECIES: hypothetical protein [unclassified Microbacterium]MCT1479144.1 hypothetical protein [Microbacterium sp. p3-SID336]MDI9890674.1 hypothetical protein [Microbacterium sp. IEGM 1404]